MKTPLRLRKWLARQLMPELDNMRTDAKRQANTEPVDVPHETMRRGVRPMGSRTHYGG